MNLEKNLEDVHSTAPLVGGNEEDKTKRLWAQDEDDEQKSPQPWISIQHGTHNALGSRMDFPHGDERVTKCLHACIHEE